MAAKIKFRIIRPDGSWTPKPRGFSYTFASATKRIVRSHIPFIIKIAGAGSSHPRSRFKTLKRVRELMKKGPVGIEFRVWGDGAVRWGVRKVKIEDPYQIPDLGCHPALEKIHGAVWDKFKAIQSAGRYYCRYVAGTYIVSKHGYKGDGWYGSAEDISAATMTYLHNIADFIVAETRAGRLDAATVIVADDIWTPGSGWQYYGGIYHYHVHVDVDGGYPCNP